MYNTKQLNQSVCPLKIVALYEWRTNWPIIQNFKGCFYNKYIFKVLFLDFNFEKIFNFTKFKLRQV